MAMGQQKDCPGDLMVVWLGMPRPPGRVSCDRLQPVLTKGGFDASCRGEPGPCYRDTATELMPPSSLRFPSPRRYSLTSGIRNQ